MKVVVVGLGKIGLPLACHYASKGHDVTGIDVNAETVQIVNEGKAPFPGETNLESLIADLVPRGRLRATTSYEDSFLSCDIVVVVVPLSVDEKGHPDYSSMDQASQSIGANLGRGTLVIYETTLPIGTTRTRWKPMLEAASGLIEGEDFHIVFSPERVLTGRVFEDLAKYPKLVGGFSRLGTEKAARFYESVIEFDVREGLPEGNGVWDLGSPEAAEMAKLAETTYRDVNIALANQFAVHAAEVGVDVFRVIEACNSQPYSHIHTPGISVGGHCIPVYPHLYLATDLSGGVVKAARAVNNKMPNHAIRRLSQTVETLEGKDVLILGVSYRPGVKETAFSGSYRLQEELSRLGARVTVVDPLYSSQELIELGFQPSHDRSNVEIVILHTDHPEFDLLSSRDFPNVKVLVDGRNGVNPKSWPSVEVISLGRPR